MSMVIPRADISEIRRMKFLKKSDHHRAISEAGKKCDPKSYAKIERGESVRSKTYESYLAPLGLNLFEGTDGLPDQRINQTTYSINEPTILSEVTEMFGLYSKKDKSINRVRVSARPVNAREMSDLLQLSQSYEVDLGTFTSRPLWMVHEQVDFSEELRDTITNLKETIAKLNKSLSKANAKQVSKGVFHSLESLIDHMGAYDALKMPLYQLKKAHHLHILGASISTYFGHEIHEELIDYHDVAFPFFLVAPLSCREAIISFDALVSDVNL